MSNFYAAASALIFALVALAHLVRLYKPVDSADWAIQGIHECIVGCPCRFCADRNLGLYAITAVVAARRSGWTAQRLAPLLSINSLMRPRTEPDNAQTQHREDSNIKQCIKHGSLH